MDNNDYLDRAEMQTIRHFTAIPCQSIRERFTKLFIIWQQNREIDEKIAQAIFPLHSGPGRFYIIRNIHKTHNEGRPIVYGIHIISKNISSFVDSIIRDIPPSCSSYVNDTTHFLSVILELFIPNERLLVTLDVGALHTNIQQADSIKEFVYAYERLNLKNRLMVACFHVVLSASRVFV